MLVLALQLSRDVEARARVTPLESDGGGRDGLEEGRTKRPAPSQRNSDTAPATRAYSRELESCAFG